jgi:hypothetical protein
MRSFEVSVKENQVGICGSFDGDSIARLGVLLRAIP